MTKVSEYSTSVSAFESGDLLDVSKKISPGVYDTQKMDRDIIVAMFESLYHKQGGNSYGAAATLGTNDNYDLIFKTNNTNRVWVKDSGLVGIGISSPANQLHVHSSSTGTAVGSRFTNGSTGSANTDGLYVGIDSSQNAVIRNYESTDFIIYNGNTEVGRFASGLYKVTGSGTTSATYSFSVHNSAAEIFKIRDDKRVSINGATYANALNINASQVNDGIYLNNADSAGSSQLGFYESGTLRAQIIYTNSASAFDQRLIILNESATGEIVFRTGGGDTGAMKIACADQNVSIGKAAYAYNGRVQIIGLTATSADYALTVSGDSGSSITNIAWFRSDGNVGFGVNVPTATIHIKAGTTAAGTAQMKFDPGALLTTGEAGAMEYNGTNLFFTPTGTTRKNVIVGTVVGGSYLIPDTANALVINVNGVSYNVQLVN